jgi:formate-dependent nitrite reductase membrane component NrfD
VLPGRPAPRGLVGGALASMVLTLGPAYPDKGTVNQVIRADVLFLAIELVLIGLLLIGLITSTESHIAAAQLITTGKFAPVFWGVVVGAGILLPLVWQWLELNHRIPHTVIPAVLVLAGGFALRWVLVNAGQHSSFVQMAGF